MQYYTIIRILVGNDLKSFWDKCNVVQYTGLCFFLRFPKCCGLGKIRGRGKFCLFMGRKEIQEKSLLYAILFIKASGNCEPLYRCLQAELRKLENFKDHNLGSACSNFTVLVRNIGFILDNVQNMCKVIICRCALVCLT